MKEHEYFLAIDSWAGRRYYPVEIINETPKKYRIRILHPNGISLPGKRFAKYGDIILVPKYAIIKK